MKRRIWPILLLLCAGLLTGCAQKTKEPEGQQGRTAEEEPEEAVPEETEEQETGGTLVLKVNPEIAVEYDKDGMVTAVLGRNEEGKKIVEGYQGYTGKECHEVVEELVRKIHDAGYFVEEVEGAGKKIVIEIETGSVVPEETFLDEIVTGVQTYVQDMQMNSPVVTENGEEKTQAEIDIYDPYGPESYEAVTSPEKETPPASSGQTPSAQQPAGSAPFHTDYGTPYEEPKPESPYTDYATPYVEPKSESPYTDYATPYVEPKPESPYTDYGTPYEHHQGDSGYSHYESHSDYH